MTGPNPSPLLSGDPSAGLAEEIRGNAGRLGLQWALLSATVTEANSASNLFARVLLDGDPEDSKARSIVGEVLTGDRVTVAKVPPEGAYIVGWERAGGMQNVEEVTTCRVDTQSTAVAPFSTILCGGVGLTIPYNGQFRKVRSDTDLVVDFRAGCFLTGAVGTTVQFGVQIGSTDYDTTFFFFNVAGQHLPMSSLHKIAGIGAGLHTITARWRRASGTGTINANLDDMFSIGVREAL